MQGQIASRKRPAPGAAPSRRQELKPNHNNNSRNSPSSRVMYRAGKAALPPPGQPRTFPNGIPDNYDPSLFLEEYQRNGSPEALESTASSPSADQVARWQRNNQVAPMKRDNYTGSMEFPPNPEYAKQTSGENEWSEQYHDIDQRALLAQRDAQSKRKQIPPFVQKLSSFLDSNDASRDNTRLIHWSEDGDSFVVEDEDEFAKTLIPELFKHNNYASFVRQLNMYGFHKKVGLADNSMKASERKGKNPSVYSHPYFKKGRPNLLWLIHKPKNPPVRGGGKSGTRAKQEDVDDDGEENFNREGSMPYNCDQVENGPSIGNGRQPLMLGNTRTSLPPDQFAALQQELADIREKQHEITQMLNATQSQNFQLFKQAKAFHQLHEQHDNSINAILTFLATIYSKNLNQGTNLDMQNLFNGLPNKQGQGNVVEVGDDKDQNTSPTQDPEPHRKQPLLLKDGSANSPTTAAASPKPYDHDKDGKNDFYNYPSKPQSMNSPGIRELDRGTPLNRSSQSPKALPDRSPDKQIPEADIMSMINRANAQISQDVSGAGMEFPEALSHLQNADGQSALTPKQRQNMLQLMSNEQNTPPNGHNVLTSYSPNSAVSLEHFALNKEQLDQISQSLREQGERMANINATIAPLSPSGSITGVTDHNYNTIGGNGSELDFDSYLNNDDYFNDGSNTMAGNYDFDNDANLSGFDFTIDAPNGTNGFGGFGEDEAGDTPDAAGGRIVEQMSSEGTSPAATMYEGLGGEEGMGSPGKKRRVC